MSIRIREEDWERQYLSPYAALSAESKGRTYPRAGVRSEDGVPAGQGSVAAFQGFSPFDGQDPGVYLSRWRSLPHPPDPHPGGGPNIPYGR